MKPRHFIACFLCVVFIAYPLSFGPAVVLNARYNSGKQPSWGVIYAPLAWAINQCPPLNAAFQWYAGKWAAIFHLE
jgi:hypothetical protein